MVVRLIRELAIGDELVQIHQSMTVTPVTVYQWRWVALNLPKVQIDLPCDARELDPEGTYSNYPATGMTFWQAKEFLVRLNKYFNEFMFSLPTKKQWLERIPKRKELKQNGHLKRTEKFPELLSLEEMPLVAGYKAPVEYVWNWTDSVCRKYKEVHSHYVMGGSIQEPLKDSLKFAYAGAIIPVTAAEESVGFRYLVK